MVLLFMGAPGSGKGTQSERVVDKLSIVQISTGEILRKAKADATPMGLEAKKFMDAGTLVPDEVVIGIIKERIVEDDCKGGFILDGFPRTVGQAEALDIMMKENDLAIDHVVYFDVPEKELVDRLLSRAKLEGRSDDNMEAIQKRMVTFKKDTEPLLDYYKNRGLVRSIDGTGTMVQVTGRLNEAIGIS